MTIKKVEFDRPGERMTIVEMIFTQPRSHPSGRERERKGGGGSGLSGGRVVGNRIISLFSLPFTVILLVHAPYLLSVGISLVFYSFKLLF